jgi:hypothetical protein
MRSTIVGRQRTWFLAGSLLAMLVLILAACGANGGPGSGPTPTATAPVANANGCPSTTVINTAPTPANVVLKPANSNGVASAHVGDVIEVDLPFGHLWTGPTTSQGELQLQQPAGYALTPAKVCVWRFTAASAGTTNLNFYGKAICQKGELCPQYILNLPYKIVVK